MKRLDWLRILRASLMVLLLIDPVSASAGLAASLPHSVPAQAAVTASAVVVPVHVAQLGFLISAIAKEVPVQEGERVKAGQTLMLLDTPDLQFAVREAEAALHSAQVYADLQKYQKVKVRRNGKLFLDTVPEEYRQRANVQVQQAQTRLEIAQVNLAQATLRAPFDGTVASVEVIAGEFVPSDRAVVTLASLDTLQVETTDLSERDITKVKVGAPVTITIEALGRDFPGKVIGITPRAEVVGGDVVFKVTIAFNRQPEGLLWGMTAEVFIQ